MKRTVWIKPLHQNFELKDSSFYPRFFYIFFTFMMTLVTSGFWLYTSGGLIAASDFIEAPGGAYFRYSCWFLLAITFVFVSQKSGLLLIFRNLFPFILLILNGMLSSLFSVSDNFPFQEFVFSVITIISGSLVGIMHKNTAETIKTVTVILFLEMIISIIFIYIFPDYATIGDGDRISWRGGFTFKTQFGIMAMWSTLFTILNFANLSFRFRLLSALISLYCIFRSDAKTSIGVLAICVAYFYLSKILIKRRFSIENSVIILLLCFTIVSIILIYFFEDIVLLLGRDVTLTGRTLIWEKYWQIAVEALPLGLGVGSISTPNDLTISISENFIQYGTITQPHNTFIDVLGETGVIGIFLYYLPLIYYSFFLPFKRGLYSDLITGLSSYAIIMGGLLETTSPFGLNFQMFILAALLSGNRDHRRDRSTPALKRQLPKLG